MAVAVAVAVAESLEARIPQPGVLSPALSARISQPRVLSKISHPGFLSQESPARNPQPQILSQESSARILLFVRFTSVFCYSVDLLGYESAAIEDELPDLCCCPHTRDFVSTVSA